MSTSVLRNSWLLPLAAAVALAQEPPRLVDTVTGLAVEYRADVLLRAGRPAPRYSKTSSRRLPRPSIRRRCSMRADARIHARGPSPAACGSSWTDSRFDAAWFARC